MKESSMRYCCLYLFINLIGLVGLIVYFSSFCIDHKCQWLEEQVNGGIWCVCDIPGIL